MVGLNTLAPKDDNPAAASVTPFQQLQKDVCELREQNNYKSLFKDYAKNSSLINESMLE